MKIAATQFNLKNKALEIYLPGCNIHCEDCHNVELWDFNNGNDVTQKFIDDIKEKVKSAKSLIENIWILGGEPLDQNKQEFINLINSIYLPGIKYWLFTGYNLGEVDKDIFYLFDFIKYGKYDKTKIKETICFGVTLMTENQGIIETKGLYENENRFYQ